MFHRLLCFISLQVTRYESFLETYMSNSNVTLGSNWGECHCMHRHTLQKHSIQRFTVLRHSQHCLLDLCDLWNKPAVGWLAAGGQLQRCSGRPGGRPGLLRPGRSHYPWRMIENGMTGGYFNFPFECWRWVMGYWFKNPFSVFENLMGNG